MDRDKQYKLVIIWAAVIVIEFTAGELDLKQLSSALNWVSQGVALSYLIIRW